MVYSSSAMTSFLSDDDQFKVVGPQVIWAALGLVSMAIVTRIDYRYWRLVSVPLFIVALTLLVIVLFVPSLNYVVGGSARFLRIGPLPLFHPAEIAKLALVIYLAHWFARRGSGVKALWGGTLVFLVIAGPVVLLVLREPDIGTTSVLVGTALVMFFVAGANLIHLGALGGTVLLGATAFIATHSYALTRVRAFIDPVVGRPNLAIVANATVRRVVIQDSRATGVELADGHRLGCRGEVILCAGALNSPHLLMLSGIGPAASLRSAGIAPLVDLPGVGKHLQDHPIAMGIWKAAAPIGFNRDIRLDRLAVNFLRWQLTGRGPLSKSPMSIQGFVRSGEEQERPDLQFQIVHSGYDARIWFPGWRSSPTSMFSCGAILLNPESRGEVTLASAEPLVLPRVQFNFISVESDRERLRRGFRFIRQFFATAPASGLVETELAPGLNAQSDAEIDAWLRASLISAGHPTSTCAMGSVVDDALRVIGVERLRVADASVMPNVIRGNTHAPTVMIAEKAADLIGGRR